MNGTTLRHETLTFVREYAATPDVVFSAYEDIDSRARWSAPSDTAVVTYTAHDFRAGGVDTFRCGEKQEPQYDGEVRYVDIVPDARIVYSEIIRAAGAPLSASLVTWTFASRANGTRLEVTVQLASFVGEDMVAGTRVGMNAALDNLGAQLRT